MRIYLVSDLHVEFHGNFSLPSEQVDVVVLAGDIGTGSDILKVAKRFRERCTASVIVVPGNHEFYYTDYVTHLADLRAASANLDGIYLLEQNAVEIGSVRFLGCTLWSDFRLHGLEFEKECKRVALQNIADFRVIRFEGGPFTPDHAAKLFRESYDWLEQELAAPYDGQTVVISHFLPHRAAVHPTHARGRNSITAYFTSACDDLMHWYPIDMWMYGHSHNSVDRHLENGVRLVSNQRGYPNEVLAYTRFNPNKIIHLKRARDNDAARRLECSMRLGSMKAILTGATWNDARTMATLAGRKFSELKLQLARWSERQKIISIYHRHTELYPTFIFDPMNRMRPYPIVAQVLRILSERRTTSWQVASWFITVNGRLGGNAPKDVLADQPELVLEAALVDTAGLNDD